MTRAAGAARSFPLVCFSADTFNFYPVRCCDTGGKPESARTRGGNREPTMEPWVEKLIRTIQCESAATTEAHYTLSHDTNEGLYEALIA